MDDTAGDGDVTIVVGEDAAGDGEVVERGAGERAILAVDGRAPEGLRSGEELVEEGAERSSWTRSFSRPCLLVSSGVYCQIHSTFSGAGFLAAPAGASVVRRRRAAASWRRRRI